MTHQDDIALDRALREAREAGRRCALATVVSTRGSTPRKVGARMVVDPVRGLVGTIGGGCGEAEVIEVAYKVAASGRAERVRVDLTDDMLSWSPAVCGGVMDVFVEAVGPSLADRRAPGERERADARGRHLERERSTDRQSSAERERSADRERLAERERSSDRERPAEHVRAADRPRIAQQERPAEVPGRAAPASRTRTP